MNVNSRIIKVKNILNYKNGIFTLIDENDKIITNILYL